MNKDNFKKNYSMQTVHRAVQILRAFSRHNKRLTLTELHSLTGIGKSSLQRLLSTLTMEGLLQKNEQDKRYQLGLDFIFFAELVEKSSSLLSIAQPVMERIYSETTESVSLSVIENKERKCIHNIESKHELNALTFVGQTSPLYAGASAKVLLAHFNQDVLENYLNDVSLEGITEHTISTKEALIEDLTKIRENGFATSHGERVKGAGSISAPIFDPFSNIFAALTTIIPSARVDDYNFEEFTDKIVKGAKEITDKLRM
ncbi:IclR family transcriptional regulator [Halobacillus amylolyticus]|uniref:IclR family transcriptional regulator n=1 Tax=Halobacillus amylolyticus TaxID=2932259 RepID=A0ABY4HD53_9BACI|nr:IclR family transcriptional regulator [Halobacillus amylolyticus]UOR11345.1 IclR family transcriptional regulator [Halobacillus amylolyticus]